MLRGVIAGGFWGALVGGLVLVLTSQVADLRDLTPALTREIVEERPVPGALEQSGADTPVVVAGAGADRPRSVRAPRSVTESAPSTLGPTVETNPTGLPAQAVTPEVAELPEPAQRKSPALEAPGAGDGAPEAGDYALLSTTPEQGSAPMQVETATAPAPARFAPDATDEIAVLEDRPSVSETLDAELSAAELPGPARATSGAVPTGQQPDMQPATPQLAAPERAKTPTPEALPRIAEETDSVADALPGGQGEETLQAEMVPDAIANSAPSDALPERLPTTPDAAPAASVDPGTGTSLPEAPAAEDSPTSVAGLGAAPDAPTRPEVSAASAPQAPEALPTLAEGDVAEPAPVQEPTQPSVATATEEAAPVIDESPESVEVASVPDAPATPGVGTDTAPANNGAAEAAAEAPVRMAEAQPRILRPGSDAASSGEEKRLPGVRVRRLPGKTAGDAANPSDDPAPAAEAAAGDQPALTRNRNAFTVPDGKALIALVLLPEEGVVLQDLPVPLTVAVDAAIAGAGDRARAFRDAGLEVAVIPDIASGALAQDAAVALSATLREVPQALALIDPYGEVFQEDRTAATEVVQAAVESGLGVVTASRGFATAARIAGRFDVPHVEVDRELGTDIEDSRAIARFFDQIAFRARSEGKIVVISRANTAQLNGIVAWAADNRDGDVVLAPLSALLTSP